MKRYMPSNIRIIISSAENVEQNELDEIRKWNY